MVATLGLLIASFFGEPGRASAAAVEPVLAPSAAAAAPTTDAPSSAGPSSAAFPSAGVLERDAVDPGAGAEVPAPPEGFNTYDGGWVRLAFPPSKRHRIQPLIQEADAFRERLRELFGYPVLNQVFVHVGRTPGEMATLAPVGSPF